MSDMCSMFDGPDKASNGSCRPSSKESRPRFGKDRVLCRSDAEDSRGRSTERRHLALGPAEGGGGPSRYGVAPTARASCRHVESQGHVSGKCSTMRRTEHSTHTASLIKRSRSVVTCAPAHVVPAARRCSS